MVRIPLFLLFLLSFHLQAQTSVSKKGSFKIKKNETIYDMVVVQKKPEFLGGERALLQWISTNINYPPSAKDAGISGKIFVSFVIDANGKIIDTRLEKGISDELNNEAIRIISSMPDWSPGFYNGKPVAVRYILPISFTLK